MPNYGKVHRFLLRSVASQGVVTMAEANLFLQKFTNSNDDIKVPEMVKEVNDQILPLKQKIKIVDDELTNEKVLVFLQLGSDDATKAQKVFTAIELEYFRILLEQILTTEARQLTYNHALNLVSGLKPTMSKTDAQKILELWCQMKYLDKEQENYALGIRTIHEFENYFRTWPDMQEIIKECHMCKKLVFRGYNCPACAEAVHTRCLNKYLETIKKWPCCKYDFDKQQLERLNNEGLSQTQGSDATQRTVVAQQNDTIEPTQDVEMTQYTIPEISQTVSRKRKRQA